VKTQGNMLVLLWTRDLVDPMLYSNLNYIKKSIYIINIKFFNFRDNHKIVSSVNLIDLAGSENIGKT